MATVQDIVDGALRKLGVTAAAETPAAAERAIGLTGLQQMMGSWNDVLKRSLAGTYAADYYTFVPLPEYASISETVELSAGWQRAMTYNLAIELAPEFGRTVPPETAAIAGESKKAVITAPAPVI